MILQKPRLNMHRKKPFSKLVAEMASAEDLSTEMVTETQECDVDDVESRELIDHNKNGSTNAMTDFNCNFTQLDTTSQA